MKATDLIARARKTMTDLGQHVHEKVRDAGSRHAEKIKGTAKKMGEELKAAPAHSKIGLGVSVTGLSMGISNYRTQRANMNNQNQHRQIEEKSLATLNKIHKALAQSTTKATQPQ